MSKNIKNAAVTATATTNLVSIADLQAQVEAQKAENVTGKAGRVTAAVARNAGKLADKLGIPTEQVEEAVKAYLGSLPAEQVAQGVTPVLTTRNLQDGAQVGLLQLMVEENPQDNGRNPYVLWIHRAKSQLERFTAWLGNRFPWAFTNEMVNEAFGGESFNAPVIVEVRASVQQIAHRFNGQGEFLLQVPKDGMIDTDLPLGYKTGNTYVFSVPGYEHPGRWVFNPTGAGGK